MDMRYESKRLAELQAMGAQPVREGRWFGPGGAVMTTDEMAQMFGESTVVYQRLWDLGVPPMTRYV